MTEKAKMIIHSVGVFLTGAVFSMALMGIVGCHVQNAYSEEASSLRQKRQALITTEGDYQGYEFTLSTNWGAEGTANYHLYSLDTTSYTLTQIDTWQETGLKLFASISQSISTNYQNSRSNQAQDIRFLVGYYLTDIWSNNQPKYSAYMSFVMPTAQVNSFVPKPFLLKTDWGTARAMQLSDNAWAWSDGQRTPYFLNYEQSQVFLLDTISTTNPVQSLTFQDAPSYYKSLGYSDGYDAGETAGHADGYQEGYADGTEGTMLFTDIGANQTRWYRADLSATDSTDTITTYKLLTYRDGNNQAHSIFALESVSDNSFLVVDYAGTSASSQYARTTLGKGTMTFSQSGAYVDVVPVNYIHYDFAQITGVFNNSIPLNYFMISGLPENATGYQQGYNKGYQDALSSSAGGVALDNVFGLFSKAFGSVASFFNLKVFGFLPLYWFFLVPIFIAVITLLLRMVKH